MHMLPRTLLHVLVTAKRRGKAQINQVTRTNFRVWPTDLDVLWHMNNGKYLSILDIARFEYIARAGILKVLNQRGWYTVVGSQTITYRKSLRPWQKFTVETKLIGMDSHACYMEQRFVRHGEIYARAYIQGRFLKKTGGTVTIAELATALDVDPATYPLSSELAAWAASVRLPATKKPAPSTW